MAVFGYLQKLLRGMGLAFAAHFQLDFSISYLFFLLKIFKQNLLFSSYLDN